MAIAEMRALQTVVVSDGRALFEGFIESDPAVVEALSVADPDTAAHHENDPSRYSGLTKNAWLNLFGRVQCTLERGWTINFNMSAGQDTFWSFILRRPA